MQKESTLRQCADHLRSGSAGRQLPGIRLLLLFDGIGNYVSRSLVHRKKIMDINLSIPE